MIELDALIFDFGNVLTQPQNQASVAAMRDLISTRSGKPVSPEAFVAAYDEFRHEYDRGGLEAKGYWKAVCGRLGFEPGASDYEALRALDLEAWFTFNPAMIQLLKDARPRIKKLGLLSNMNFDGRGALLAKADWLGFFDDLVLSCEHFIVKPSPAIYELSLSRLGVEAGRALFVDDLEVNIAAARARGIHGHHFKGAQALIAELGLGGPGGRYCLGS